MLLKQYFGNKLKIKLNKELLIYFKIYELNSIAKMCPCNLYVIKLLLKKHHIKFKNKTTITTH